MKPTPNRNIAADLAALDEKVNALLPARYQHCYTSVSPNSMGSAGLKYGPDGKVAWDEIWTTFCDLALAGGPPHRGELMLPVAEDEAIAAPDRQKEVLVELDRAIGMTTGMPVVPGYAPGWLGVKCWGPEEAAWLQLAVTAENVSARRRQSILQLPVGPAFRIEKEIKNVVVSLAKANHYWDGHLSPAQQALAGENLWEPATPGEIAANPAAYEASLNEIESLLKPTGLPIFPKQYAGWIGIETRGDEDAVWLLRAILVEQMLVRRQGKVLYLPVGATATEGQAARVGSVFCSAWELCTAAAPRRAAWRPSGSTRKA